MNRKPWFAIPAVLLATQLAACSDGGVTQTQESATCACPIEWKVDNISICGAESTAARPPLLYSTVPTAGGGVSCGTEPASFPPPVPAADWSKQRISSMCAGSGTLCVSLRQGDWEHPKDDDCVLARQCTTFEYEGGNKLMELPPIEAWNVTDQACAYKFEANDGYLEFENESNLGCKPVDQKQVCPLSCAKHPDTAECQKCLQETDPDFITKG